MKTTQIMLAVFLCLGLANANDKVQQCISKITAYQDAMEVASKAYELYQETKEYQAYEITHNPKALEVAETTKEYKEYEKAREAESVAHNSLYEIGGMNAWEAGMNTKEWRAQDIAWKAVENTKQWGEYEKTENSKTLKAVKNTKEYKAWKISRKTAIQAAKKIYCEATAVFLE